MTLQECYTELHGDYSDARKRLLNDILIKKYLTKFTADATYRQLADAVAVNDRKASFLAAHTLKGVAANLGFTELQENASALTEQLRDLDQDPDPALFEAVECAYSLVISTIERYNSMPE